MARGATHKGWWRDAANNRLAIYYNSNIVGYVDASSMYLADLTVTGATTLNGALTISGANATVGGNLSVTGTASLTGNVSGAAALGVAGKVTYYDQLIHGNASVTTITANTTLTISDMGKVFECATTNISFALPATVLGYTYTIVNTGADSTASVVVTAVSDDRIFGPDMQTTSGSANSLTNTAATHKAGDYIKLFGDGTQGWFVQDIAGTWAT